MLDALRTVWAFLTGLPRDLFEDRVDTGWGIASIIYVTVVAIAFAIGGYRSVHEYIKAVDIRFDKAKLDHYNMNGPSETSPRKIDWFRARKEQVQSLRFTIPLGILVLTTLYLWVRESFTLETYFKLAAVWLVAALPLRLWWIATVIWTERKLAKTEPRQKPANPDKYPLETVSVRWAVKHYLNWGLQKSTIKRPPYIGLLRPLNPVVKFFGLRWMQVRLIRPLVKSAFFACIWPLSIVIAVFYLTHELNARRPVLRPSWSSSGAKEPIYSSGAIPGSSGDAAAARA